MYLAPIKLYSQFFSKSVSSRTLRNCPLNKGNYVLPKISNNNKNLFKFTTNRVLSLNVQSIIVCKRTFHTTNSNKALPPIIWALLRPVFKFIAVLTGRGLKKWWSALPKERRKFIIREFQKHKKKIFIGAGLSSAVVYVYYIMHLVEDPITKRKKFLLFSETQIKQMAMIECEVVMENYKKKIITTGYQYNHVLQIAQRILQANKHLPGTKRKWQVLIIDEPETKNAFVLPSGHIFIFTGMLQAVSNDDQLAAIIGHEMSHALLSHSAEVASKTHLLEMLMLLPILALWTLLPDSIAASSHYFTEYISAVLFRLPFSRSLETEADTVGLEMISRACFDPRQASVFWRKMEKLAEDEQIELLSTHPSHKTRYTTLEGLMPKAFRILTQSCRQSDMNPHLSRF